MIIANTINTEFPITLIGYFLYKKVMKPGKFLTHQCTFYNEETYGTFLKIGVL